MSFTAGERRVVAALIADITDSTRIGELLGPERSKFFFDEIVRLMREEVERFGGTVAQLTGDGILAIFGAPTAHEDDSARAVRAAIALRESIARYGAEVGAAYGVTLAARVAVNTGPVVVPQRDLPPDVLYNALGDTVNVAARLQALGDLVVGPETARQLGDLFLLEEMGEVELKGKAMPVQAFRVIGARDASEARPEAPFVGRDQELGVLTEAIRSLVPGTGAIASITGEAGIGKSRLVAEIADRFAASVRVLTGHAATYAEDIPYWPIRELLRSWVGLGSSDSEARARLELRAALARDLPADAEDAYPLLSSLMGLALDPEQERRLRDFAPDAVQRQTFDTLYQLVVALAAQRPLCLVLEDLQSTDEATLTLLEELLPAAEHAPIAFLLVHRNDPDHRAWQLVDRARRRFRRLFVDLDLEPLVEDDVRALAESDAGGPLSEEFTQLLVERVGGNPYFVGEAIRDLRERRALEQPRHASQIALDAAALFPTALQGALQARLDRLDTEQRNLISIAAVIGRSFSLPLLERLLPRARLLPVLSELQWLQLLVEERRLPAPEYRFRHGLVQEVAYAALVEADRREIHLRVGEALLEQHHDSPAEVYGLLAHHFVEADETQRAVEFLLKAGDAARAIYADDEAIALYRRALGFMDHASQAARARETLLKMALTHHLAFDFRAANDAFKQAFAIAAPAVVQLEPTERLAWVLNTGWDREFAPGHGYSLQSFETAPNLFRGLLAGTSDLDIRPDLAARLSVSDDGLTYRFAIRPDALWSDGVPVSAEDFAFTFDHMRHEDVPTAFWLEGITASALDAQTVEIRLREARSDFLYALCQVPLFPWPKHAHEQYGPEWRHVLPLVGNGPFVLTEHEESRFVMVAADNWSAARGNVGEVIVEIEALASVAADRWRRGDYDVMSGTLAGQTVVDERTVLQSAPGISTWYLGFNSAKAPFDDVHLRLAAAHAIDRQRPSRLLDARSAGEGGLVPPTIPGHSPRVAPAFDPDRARELLVEAGHPGGRDLDEIVLACIDLWQSAAYDIAVQLEAVGMPTRVLVVATDPELEVASREADAFVWAWGGDYADTGRGFLEPFVHTAPVYMDEQLEALLGRARSLRDQDERLRTYREFERILIGERVAVVPLAYGDYKFWQQPWVSGLWVNPVRMSTLAEAVVTRPAAPNP